MSDLPRYPDGGQKAPGTDSGGPTTKSRSWARVVAIVVAVVVLVAIVALHVSGTIGLGGH
jgi:hypothetical protein